MAIDPETVVKPQRALLNVGNSTVDPQLGSSLVQLLFTPTSDATAASRIREIQLGSFQIEKFIGKGGMATVFLAKDLRLDRLVALKVLNPSYAMDDSVIQRFHNEAKAAARLDHPNIARVHYSGEQDGLHYIAFEFVAGKNVRELIKQQGRMSPAVAVNHALQIANALNHSSGRGVIHRDVKPSNIIISPNGRTKLVDLGLARFESPDGSADLTVDGTTLGTFDYIAPEQAKDPRKVDVRADLYGLGCTLYHMLTGEPPYPEGTVLQKLLDHQASQVPDPAAKNRQVSEALSNVVRKLMAPNPEHRYPSAEHAIHDLMVIAGSYGLRGVNSEGLVWTGSADVRPRFVERHLGWVTAAFVLAVLAIGINKFPNATANSANDGPQFDGKTIEQQLVGKNTDVAMKTEAKPDKSGLPNPKEAVVRPSDPPEQPGTSPGESGTGVGPTDEEADAVATLLSQMIPGGLPPIIPDGEYLTSTAPPSTPITTPTPPENPPEVKVPAVRLLASETGASTEFQTIEAAVQAAKSGDIVELHYNGIREGSRPERPWQIINKKIAIRASQGFRPTIPFRFDESSPAIFPGAIVLQKSRLDLVNVNLQMNPPDSIPSENGWALFSLSRSGQAHLSGVSVSIANPNQVPVAVFRVEPAPSDVMPDEVGNSGATEHSIGIVNCSVSGRCALLAIPHDQPSRVELENCALILDGSLTNGCLLNVRPGTSMPSEGREISVNLKHTTCVVNNGLLQVNDAEAMGGTRMKSHLPIRVTARDNIFSTESSEPFVRMSGNLELDDFQKLLTWDGSMNFYEAFQVFWHIKPTMNADDLQQVAFENWKQLWQQSDPGAENGAVLRSIAWSSNWRLGKSLRELNVSDLRLDASTGIENPALNGATDGTNVGADIDRLPALQAPPADPTSVTSVTNE